MKYNYHPHQGQPKLLQSKLPEVGKSALAGMREQQSRWGEVRSMMTCDN